jgi:hypothetical protein
MAKEFLLAKKTDNLHPAARTGSELWRNSFIEQDCDYLLAQTCVKYLCLSTFEMVSSSVIS